MRDRIDSLLSVLNPSRVTIRKASGEVEAFQPEKLRRSLLQSGAPVSTVDSVLRDLLPKIRSGMTTEDVYTRAHRLLGQEAVIFGDRYRLKRAIMELGPSGFPFEKYVAALIRHTGKEVTLNQTIQGKCVTHEVDVIVREENGTGWTECKFHNQPGSKTDIKTALYCYARYLDLREGPLGNPEDTFRVVTNTKFSSDAIKYAECMGMQLMGWNYPTSRPFQKLVEDSGLYPITCLTTLKSKKIQSLLRLGVALISELPTSQSILDEAGLSRREITSTLAEAEMIMQHFPGQ